MKLNLILVISVLCVKLSQAQIGNDIVIVNIGNRNREEIAIQLEKISSFHPKVIAIDVKFDQEGEAKGDSYLAKVLWSSKNIILPSLIDELGGRTSIGFAGKSIFSPSGSKTGFINALQEEDSQGTLKRFIVWENDELNGGKVEYHFAIVTVMAVDSLAAMNFVSNNEQIIDIDYKHGARKFQKITMDSPKKITRSQIEGKIILIGFLGPGDDDKFYTPLNTKHKKPDMYGVECIANIIVQILEYSNN